MKKTQINKAYCEGTGKFKNQGCTAFRGDPKKCQCYGDECKNPAAETKE